MSLPVAVAAIVVGACGDRCLRRAPARRDPAGLLLVLGLLLPVVVTGPGCSINAEEIERWKGTEKGPGKLREALKNGALSVELRAQALAALVEIGSVGDVDEDLKEIPEAQKKEVVHAATRTLIAMARGKGTPDPANTTRLERQGKDGLVAVRESASAEDRKLIDAELIEWTTLDLEGRMTAGSNSGEKVLTTIGAAAGPRMVELIGDARQNDANRTSAVRILARIGDREQNEAGGAKLVERARAEQKGKISEATFGQLGMLGGDHITAYLTSLATDAKAPAALRGRALMAMSQAPDPASLDMALKIAGDAKADPELRDSAFELLGKLGAPTLPGLSRMLNDKNDKIRWEVVETMLFAGKLAAIPAVLEGLSPARAYAKEDLRDFVVRDLTKLGPLALPPLREALKSSSWVARISAAMAIAELGRADDAPRIEALAGDGYKLKGWAGGATIGTEAKSLAAQLRGKR